MSGTCFGICLCGRRIDVILDAFEKRAKELGWVKADSESLIKAIGKDTCKLCLVTPKNCGYSVESGCEGFKPKPKVVKG